MDVFFVKLPFEFIYLQCLSKFLRNNQKTFSQIQWYKFILKYILELKYLKFMFLIQFGKLLKIAIPLRKIVFTNINNHINIKFICISWIMFLKLFLDFLKVILILVIQACVQFSLIFIFLQFNENIFLNSHCYTNNIHICIKLHKNVHSNNYKHRTNSINNTYMLKSSIVQQLI